MTIGFVIIQIGNPQLDELCTKAIVPAIKAVGLEPKRVDKHNKGGLLKSEIIRFIQDATLIVADVTNERPNCYLEIGYTMGVQKFENLVLTVREDHFPDSPNHEIGGPKVHFDLGGYDILRWQPGSLEDFRVELEKRLRRRLAILAPPGSAPRIWSTEWLDSQRNAASAGLLKMGFTAFMEVRFALAPPKTFKTQKELEEAARLAPIETFGWPFALYLPTDDGRPRPRADGIVAEIHREGVHKSYDYWAIHRNGDFFGMSSLFEDQRDPAAIFFNTRIVRVTECLLYCARFYGVLGVDRSTTVHVVVRHSGFGGRSLRAASLNRDIGLYRKTTENSVESEIALSLGDIEAGLVTAVKQLVSPLFVLFDFFELADPAYEDIVNRFVKGEVS